MPNDNVTRLIQPGSFDDPLTQVLRDGARTLLAQAVEAEVAAFLAKHADLKTDDGRARIVRHGHLPEREVMTGIGPVAVRQPRVRDRAAAADAAERIRFATVRHRTIRSKGCLSNTTALAMVFKLVEAAQKSWRRLDGHNQLPKVVLGAKFTDGLEVIASDRQSKAAA